MTKENKVRLMIATVVFISGIILFLYGSLISNFFRGFVGDILVVVFLFFFLSSFIKTRRSEILIGVFTFVAGIELLQMYVSDGFGGKIGELVVGSTFDPVDFIAYGLGIFAAYILNIFVDKLKVQ